MNMSLVEIEKNGKILEVALNRPEIHNAFNADVIKILSKTFSDKKISKEFRAVVLRGNGPSFCAGGDLEWMRSLVGYSKQQNMKDAQQLYNLFDSIYRCPIPVIGRLHGNVRGGGLGLTAACDIVAAEEDTKFGFSEAHLGLVPSVICPFVSRKMNESSLRELMITGMVFSARRAYDTGLVHFVGSSANVHNYIQDIISHIHKCGPEAIQITKGLIDFVKNNNMAKTKARTIKVIAERRTSKEGQEGMRAFLEKRTPNWRTE
jgi:methylglutaconyl-CoA hydratase